MAKARTVKNENDVKGIPKSLEQALPMVTEIDEEVFVIKYGKHSTATATDSYRGNEDIGDAARECLRNLSAEMIDHLKKNVSVLRKYTCLTMMRSIKNEGDWEDVLIDEEETVK